MQSAPTSPSLAGAIDRLVEFHLAFRHPVPFTISVGDPEKRLLRLRLIVEELVELADSLGANNPYQLIAHLLDELEFAFDIPKAEPQDFFTREVDVVNVARELSDLLVVVVGAGVSMGYAETLDECFNNVMDANMSKLGKDGRPLYRQDGKIMKGPDFRPPNLTPILFPESSSIAA